MSAAVHREPYQLPAGILAVVVHGAFFSLLYFGFSWRSEAPVAVSVELWENIPGLPAPPPEVEEPKAETPKMEVRPNAVEEVPPPKPETVTEAPPPKPTIALPDKKPDKKIVEPPQSRPKVAESAPSPQPVARQAEASTDEERQAAREQAERAAAVGRVVDEYTSKIVAKIRRNIVMPPGVADDAQAEFLVTLLPGGSVLGARLQKSSGNGLYDSAVERAILKSQPLPLPADGAVFNRFRELRLVFRPKESRGDM